MQATITRDRIAKIPARQLRSQQTVDRIIAAARALLEMRSWEELTMSDLAKAADCNIGSIYARFEGKAALLDHLDELYAQEILDMVGKSNVIPADTTLQAAIMLFVKGLADHHRKNAGLVRTLIIETRAFGHPEFHARSKRMNARLAQTGSALSKLAKAEGHTITEARLNWALFFIVSSVREAVLFPAGIPRPAKNHKAQVDEIAHMALAYLGVD